MTKEFFKEDRIRLPKAFVAALNTANSSRSQKMLKLPKYNFFAYLWMYEYESDPAMQKALLGHMQELCRRRGVPGGNGFRSLRVLSEDEYESNYTRILIPVKPFQTLLSATKKERKEFYKPRGWQVAAAMLACSFGALTKEAAIEKMKKIALFAQEQKAQKSSVCSFSHWT